MKIYAINTSYYQSAFHGKKNKYEKLPDYNNYYREQDIYGSIEPLDKDQAENIIKLVNNKDLKVFAQNFYDKEHFISPNVAGFIWGIDSGLENIKDKKLKKDINNSLNVISGNIKNGGTYLEYEEAINLISNVIDSYNTLNGNYSRYYTPDLNLGIVKYKQSHAKHEMKIRKIKTPYIFQKTNEDLETIFRNKKNPRLYTNAKDIVENQRTEAFANIAKYRNISDYIYIKHYLNTNKFSPEICKLCMDIYMQYGTMVILSNHTNKRHNIQNLKIIKKELSLWKKYGKDEAKFPDFINLSIINSQYRDTYSDGYYSPVQNGIFIGTFVKDSIRHEMTHLNDRLVRIRYTNDKKYLELIRSIMPSKTIMVNGKEKSVQDFENCKYREEFLKAGVIPSDIKYAYTNKEEFIAVASQGDMSQYSDEFKQILVAFGLPKFALNMPQTNTDILSNVAQVKRIQKLHPECQDYDSILKYYVW